MTDDGESGSFKSILQVLEDIEGGKSCNDDCDDQLERTPARPPLKVRGMISGSSLTHTSVTWVSEVRKAKPNRKSLHPLLHRPGFVYRKKDLSKTSFLDNNFWEYTCGRRVLKPPSFKYKKKSYAASSSIAMVLQDLDNLTLSSILQSKPKSCQESASGCQFISSTFTNCAKSSNFLPLTSSVAIGDEIRKSKSKKSIVRSARPWTRPSEKAAASNNALPVNLTFESTALAQHGLCFGALSKEAGQIQPPHEAPPYCKWRQKGPLMQAEKSSTPLPASSAEVVEPKAVPSIEHSCSFLARAREQDTSTNELSIYMEDMLFLPQKMSCMAEMMYT